MQHSRGDLLALLSAEQLLNGANGFACGDKVALEGRKNFQRALRDCAPRCRWGGPSTAPPLLWRAAAPRAAGGQDPPGPPPHRGVPPRAATRQGRPAECNLKQMGDADWNAEATNKEGKSTHKGGTGTRFLPVQPYRPSLDKKRKRRGLPPTQACLAIACGAQHKTISRQTCAGCAETRPWHAQATLKPA